MQEPQCKFDEYPEGFENQNPDYISKNFNYSELIASNTATRLGIDNTPDEIIKKNLKDSVINLHQKVRDLLGYPMTISSGYRCHKLNVKVGGAVDKYGKSTSDHCYGYAIDFTCPRFGTPQEIVKFLSKELPKRGIPFHNLILEFPQSPNSWVHLSWKNRNGAQKNKNFVIQ